MIPEFTKILYTTDLSDNARHAFGYAVGLANRYNAGVTVLHVLEDLSPSGDSLVVNMIGEKKWSEIREQNEKTVLETMQTRLKAFCDDVSSEFPACQFITDDIIVRIGIPVEEILAQVESGDYDLVVMGAHGRGVLSDTFMGSTSRRVLRRCKTPVLVIRLPEGD
jgi:nucleotide-binding universal stress UspA family protein